MPYSSHSVVSLSSGKRPENKSVLFSLFSIVELHHCTFEVFENKLAELHLPYFSKSKGEAVPVQHYNVEEASIWPAI